MRFPAWYTSSITRGLQQQPAGLILAAATLIPIIAAALLAPLLGTYSPLAQDLLIRNHAPSWVHLLGTDHLGRDVLARLLDGGRTTLLVSTVGTLLAFVLGAGVGLLAVTFGRVSEALVFGFIDLVRAMPGTLLALLLIVALGSGALPLILALGLSFSPQIAYVARASYRREIARDYVRAARTFGGTRLHILGRHIVPNVAGALVTQVAIILPRCIVTESVLSFLGVGSSPDAPTWGRMISDAARSIQTAPHVLVAPLLALIILTICISIVGDHLRRGLDPVRSDDSAIGREARPA
ncbi:ABC transporter permease [Devosia sp.]|uniref:ABC transporter permease n=1 Tax=Devosia sp. TaxID=1871048 RepID=UPI002EF11F6E